MAKCGLITESFSLWLKYPKMNAKSLPWALSTPTEDAKGIDLAPIFEGLKARVKNFLRLSHLYNKKK